MLWQHSGPLGKCTNIFFAFYSISPLLLILASSRCSSHSVVSISLSRKPRNILSSMAEVSLPAVQLVDGDGCFNVEGLGQFVRSTKLPDYGVSYGVVAVIGPQSSGKSTLLNHLFGTKFKEMDASEGRCQTTQGIWIEKYAGSVPFIIVMDLEGTDGSERGEDDTVFEKQSALFALAIADVVLVNMWCHDIGREHAANKPLLKMVFQVMMHLFGPRKTTLLFVIRDQTKTPPEKLDTILRQDIQKTWDAVSKPEAYKDTPLSEFFNVKVTTLSSYEEKEEQFKEQVPELRDQIVNLISPGGVAGDRQRVVPASGFSFSAQQIWKLIKENKDLDLPAHKVMVATVRCEEIANEKLDRFFADENWLSLEAAIQEGPVQGFREGLNAILDTYLFEYDKETIYFDEDVRIAKRRYLQSKALDEAYKRVPNWPTPAVAPPPAPAPAPARATFWSVVPVAVSAAVSVTELLVNLFG